MPKLILASKSPRRKEILSHLGLEFTTLVSDADEETDLPSDPAALVETLACRKANIILTHKDYTPGDLVIGADTVVCYKGKILTKPANREEAKKMLKMLSGHIHTVFSGICITNGNTSASASVCTTVKMRKISGEEIEAYVETGEPLDKAGAYGIQDLDGIFVEYIKGDYYNVVGLPLETLALLLDKHFNYKILEKTKYKR